MQNVVHGKETMVIMDHLDITDNIGIIDNMRRIESTTHTVSFTTNTQAIVSPATSMDKVTLIYSTYQLIDNSKLQPVLMLICNDLFHICV